MKSNTQIIAVALASECIDKLFQGNTKIRVLSCKSLELQKWVPWCGFFTKTTRSRSALAPTRCCCCLHSQQLLLISMATAYEVLNYTHSRARLRKTCELDPAQQQRQQQHILRRKNSTVDPACSFSKVRKVLRHHKLNTFSLCVRMFVYRLQNKLKTHDDNFKVSKWFFARWLL